MTVDREELRRRVLAFTGLWLLLVGLLAALGFVVLVWLAVAVTLTAVLTAGGLWLLRRRRVPQRLRSALSSLERALQRLDRRLDDLGLQQRMQRLETRVWKLTTLTTRRARAFLARGGRSSVTTVLRWGTRTSEVLRTGGRRLSSLRGLQPRPVDPRREAIRLNELGAQLRRAGKHEQAAERHRAALAIVRDLGDQRAEALTLNNLALALARAGAVAAAVQHFQQALIVVRELGDEEHEGRVIANLGFVHRRQGRSKEAADLLHAALDKLPPESSAYRQVEEQLRRAS